jgi:hypothetical protein
MKKKHYEWYLIKFACLIFGLSYKKKSLFTKINNTMANEETADYGSLKHL